ncbi:MAG: alpha/beta hydrolase [Flavobacteriales bacterium]
MRLIFLFVTMVLLAGCNQRVMKQPEYGMPETQNAFAIGVIDTMYSASLVQKRTLNIYLPEGYDADTASTYPVIYLLDGSANEDFVHTVGVVQFQTMIGMMKPCIVVGIANVDRKYDFTFPTNNVEDRKSIPRCGGSSSFMDFIEMELQPSIEKKYRTNQQSILIGQSLGGLLATEILLKRPQMFTHYIIVSPSLWWDDESLLTNGAALIAKQDYSCKHIFITVGNEDDQMEDEAKRLYELLDDATGGGWSHSFYPMPEESHLTILHNALYKAFGQLLNH